MLILKRIWRKEIYSSIAAKIGGGNHSHKQLYFPFFFLTIYDNYKRQNDSKDL